MADSTPDQAVPAAPVSLTLQIEPRVYQAFLRKARQAGMEIEPFLTNTLTIVLGCRVFNDKYADPPAERES